MSSEWTQTAGWMQKLVLLITVINTSVKKADSTLNYRDFVAISPIRNAAHRRTKGARALCALTPTKCADCVFLYAEKTTNAC